MIINQNRYVKVDKIKNIKQIKVHFSSHPTTTQVIGYNIQKMATT